MTQKSKLLEQLLASPRMREVDAGNDDVARRSLARARELLTRGQSAAAAGEYERAESALNDALRTLSAAVPARGAPGPATPEQRQRNADLVHEINVYRAALNEVVTAGKARAQAPQLAATDRLMVEAQQRQASGQHAAAEPILRQAQRTVVAALAEARAGDTVTIELKFETPADEYAYELRRFNDHLALLHATVAERRPGSVEREAIEAELGLANRLHENARTLATAGDHGAAIRLMEQATGHLLRALQAAGMPAMR